MNCAYCNSIQRLVGTVSTLYYVLLSCMVVFQTSTENMGKLPEIILLISWKGVKFVDAHSKVCYGGAVCGGGGQRIEG